MTAGSRTAASSAWKPSPLWPCACAKPSAASARSAKHASIPPSSDAHLLPETRSRRKLRKIPVRAAEIPQAHTPERRCETRAARPTSPSGLWRHHKSSLCVCREEQHLLHHISTTRESGGRRQPSPAILGKPENPPAIRCGRSSSTFPERARFFPAKDTAGARRSHKKPREGWRTMPRRPPHQYAARRQRTAAQCPHPSTLPKQSFSLMAPRLPGYPLLPFTPLSRAEHRSPSVLRWRHARESPS